MGKKRKGGGSSGAHGTGSGKAQGGDERDAPVLPKAPERLASPFKSALGPLKKQLEDEKKRAEEEAKRAREEKRRPAPPPPPAPMRGSRAKREHAEDEATALSMAMQGVKPLTDTRPARVTATTPKIASRIAQVAPFGRSAEEEARARLDDLVAQDVSFRIESDGDFVRGSRIDAPPRAVRELARRTRASETLDLHGMSQREARDAVIAFIRRSHRQGLSTLCIVHGKGQHSEGGIGVLRDCVVRALTDSGAAPLVFVFATASDACGGTGALLVELKH